MIYRDATSNAILESDIVPRVATHDAVHVGVWQATECEITEIAGRMAVRDAIFEVTKAKRK